MRLVSIEIEEFGKLQNCSFDLDPGINLFEGPNESGKSTLLAFLRFALYGFPRRVGPDGEERERRLSWQGHRASGKLILELAGEQYCIFRRVTRQGASERESYSEQLRVTELLTGKEVALGGASPGEHFLGLPATLYDSTLYLQQSDAARVAAPDVGEAVGNVLFSGSTGTSADTAQEKLNLARRELQHRKGRGGRIIELEDTLAEQQRILSRAKEDAAQLAELRDRAHKCQAALNEKKEQHTKAMDAFEQAGIAQTLSLFEQLHAAQRTLDQKKLEHESIVYQNASLKLPDEQTITLLETAVRARTSGMDAAARVKPELDRLKAIHYNEDMIAANTVVKEKGGAEAVAKDFALAQKRKHRRRSCAAAFFLLGALFAALAALLSTGILAPLLNLFPVGTYLPDVILLCTAGAGAFLLFFLLFALGARRCRRRAKAWMKRLHLKNPAMFRTYLLQCAAEAEAQETHRNVQSGFEAEWGTYLQQVQEAEQTIRKVMVEYGFGDIYNDVKDLPVCLAQMQEKRRCANARREDARLAMERAGAAVEALAKPLAEYREPALRARFKGEAPTESPEVLRQMQENLQREIAVLDANRSELEHHIAALSATAKDPAAVQAKIQTLTEELSAARVRLSALDLAMEALGEAVDTLRRGVTPKLCEEASAVLCKLTDGAYKTLHPAPDFSVTLDCDAGMLPLSRFSAGCRDAAYLALRLGLLSTLTEQRVPLLFDEAFSRLDDDRTRALLDVLCKYCADGGQCLLFSCHSREGKFLQGREHKHFMLT